MSLPWLAAAPVALDAEACEGRGGDVVGERVLGAPARQLAVAGDPARAVDRARHRHEALALIQPGRDAVPVHESPPQAARVDLAHHDTGGVDVAGAGVVVVRLRREQAVQLGQRAVRVDEGAVRVGEQVEVFLEAAHDRPGVVDRVGEGVRSDREERLDRRGVRRSQHGLPAVIGVGRVDGGGSETNEKPTAAPASLIPLSTLSCSPAGIPRSRTAPLL